MAARLEDGSARADLQIGEHYIEHHGKPGSHRRLVQRCQDGGTVHGRRRWQIHPKSAETNGWQRCLAQQ
jgi:hypothetical protein